SNVAAGRDFNVTGELTVNGIYRVGIAGGRTSPDGGPVNNIGLYLKQQGSIEGHVVYAGYKVFDPHDSSKNVLDPTPNDPTDNAHELDYPYRPFGDNRTPRQADINGRFLISNVFTGAIRATAWSSDNQELRGDWGGVLVNEGDTVQAYVVVGTQGFGPATIHV